MRSLVRNKTTSDLYDEHQIAVQQSSLDKQYNGEVWQQILSLDSRFSYIRPVLREDPSNRTLYIRRRQELFREASRIQQQLGCSQAESADTSSIHGNSIRSTSSDRMVYKLLRERLLISLYGSPPSVKSMPHVAFYPSSQNVENSVRHQASVCSSVPDSSKSTKSLSDGTSSSAAEDHPTQTSPTEDLLPTNSTHNSQLMNHEPKSESYQFSGIDHIFDHHAGAINRLRFANNDNSRLAVASSDGTISICSTWPPGEERRIMHVLFGGHAPATPVTDVVWSFANDFLVSTALDGNVCLWDAETGSVRRIYLAESVDVGPVLVCAFQPLNYNLLVVGGAWGRIQTLNLSTGKLVKKGKDQIHSTGFKSTKSINSDMVKCNGQGCILALTFDQGSGAILWVGTDRGVIQSYSCQPATGHLVRSQRLNLAARHLASCLEDPSQGDEVGPYGIALLPAALKRPKPNRFVSEASSLRSTLRRKTSELLAGQVAESAFPAVTSLNAYSWLVRETGDAYLLANAAGLGLLLFKIASPSNPTPGALILERRFPLKHRSPTLNSNQPLRMIHSCFAPLLSTGAHVIAGNEEGNVCVFDVLSKASINAQHSICRTFSHTSTSLGNLPGLITVLQGHHSAVLDVAIGWDENVLASGDESGSVIIWRNRNFISPSEE